jgi:transposase-like protein
MELLQRAIVQSGGISALAKQLGVSAQSLHHWRTRGLPTSEWLGTSDYAKQIETATGISAAELLAASRAAKDARKIVKRRKAA